MYIFLRAFFYRFVLFSIFDWSICTLFSELHVANVSIRCITNIIMVFELMDSLFQAPIDKINIFSLCSNDAGCFICFFGMMLMMMMMADDVKNRYGGLCSPPQIITSSNNKKTHAIQEEILEICMQYNQITHTFLRAIIRHTVQHAY